MSVTNKIPIERFDVEKLRKWCKENGTSLSALAKRMGYSSKALANIGHSKNTHITPSLYNLLCYTCGVSQDYFLRSEKEEPKAAESENENELTEINPKLNEILKILKNIERKLT